MHRQDQKRVITLIRSLDRRYLPLAVVKSLLVAVIPYLMILLPAWIVNLLYENTHPAQILLSVCLFYLAILIVRTVFQLLKKETENRKNQILNSYAVRKVRKIFNIQFHLLETSAFEKILQGIHYNDENFGAFRNYMEELEKIFQSVFQIFIAVGIFCWMAADIAKTADIARLVLGFLGLVAVTLLSIVIMLGIQKAVHQRMPALMDKIVDVNTMFYVLYEEVVQNYRKGKDVRLFGIDRLVVREGEKMVENFGPYIKKQIWLSQAEGIAGSVLSLLIGGAAFAVMGRYALQGAIEPGNVISFAGSIQQLSAAVIGIAFSLGSLNLWNVRMDHVFQLFALEEEPEEKSPRTKKIPTLETIEFRDVSFRYPESQEDTLKNISLTIHRGEKIAAVGPNGSGKSTFIKLLTGLYEPTAGRILFNGRDRSEIDRQTWRAYMASVYQDFMIFSFTLGENIVLGDKRDAQKIADVLKRLKLTEKVEHMKDKIDTWLYQDYGEDGRELSGGEAQKLALCRALYKDAPFIVLDEPTAALDPVAEYEIYKDFETLVEDKTAVLVSHRLSSCKYCRKIFVFDNGSIVQSGSHSELLQQQDGLYKTLWDAQAQYYVEG